MNILVAEDDAVSRTVLTGILRKWDFESVMIAEDGSEAWRIMNQENAPKIALLDWDMPGMDGLSVCRRIREKSSSNPPYIIILTGRGEKDEIIRGLDAGADDYITKPFDKGELKARLEVGRRTVKIQEQLAALVQELQASIEHIKTLQGILPVCSHCKKIRDDKGYWNQIDAYIEEHSDADISHSICPECAEKYYPNMDLYGD